MTMMRKAGIEGISLTVSAIQFAYERFAKPFAVQTLDTLA